jgi:hypothetical protein
MIFGAGFSQGFPFVVCVALLLLVIAFAGLLRGVHAILYGPAAGKPAVEAAGWRPALPVAAACALLLLTGIAWPPGLGAALDRIVAIVVP